MFASLINMFCSWQVFSTFLGKKWLLAVEKSFLDLSSRSRQWQHLHSGPTFRRWEFGNQAVKNQNLSEEWQKTFDSMSRAWCIHWLVRQCVDDCHWPKEKHFFVRPMRRIMSESCRMSEVINLDINFPLAWRGAMFLLIEIPQKRFLVISSCYTSEFIFKRANVKKAWCKQL